ncbi:hypothetical protein NQ314_012520 [Rhamnusium bicolor]|uniref:BED-type domain-containing protein n=1 Tax=Rhamnusium bicolor TaxID=1586634 RepID=A0AAV8XAJ4_9CUCU|nr:hypothetical protein NQ314_012520 [Rhamnusium bicolor]
MPITEFLSAKVAKARRDKRIWDKRDFCLYCYENVTNFSRHLLRKHNSEVAVKQFMNMRLGSIERKNFIDLLRKKETSFLQHKNKLQWLKDLLEMWFQKILSHAYIARDIT